MPMPTRLAPILVTPSAGVLTVPEVRQHLREDATDNDVLILALIRAVEARLDGGAGILGRCLAPQVWTFRFTDFPADGGALALPLAPVQSVDSVIYRTAAADVALTTFGVERGGGDTWCLYPTGSAGWPSVDRPAEDQTLWGVEVTATLGYDAAIAAVGGVPGPIRAAMLLMIGDLYRHRDTVAIGQAASIPLSVTVDALLAPYRRVWL